MEDKTKIQHRSDLSPEYFPILGGLLSLMNNEKEAGIIEIPFVLTCAATLECLLNDKIILYCIETYGSDDYEQFAEPLIWDGFLKKINTIIPLLSHNQYNIRTDSECYIELKGLIDVRNSLTHNKSYLKEYEAKVTSTGVNQMSIIVPHAITEPKLKLQLKSIDCHRLYNSILELDGILRYPLSFSENRVIQKITTFDK